MLIVNNLRKTYANGVQALAGVSLQVDPGLYGLLGPNGAGKSTLMRTLATLQTPDSGSFSLDGIDALERPAEIRGRLGYLPQQIGAYPGVNARDLLERFAWLKGRTEGKQRKAEVAALLEKVNLTDAASRPVASYSGGMLRRFGIAIALIGAPRLLIVDEPTAGLDPAERNRFHRVLADVAADAIVLFSTHIVEDIENLCERLSILAKGRIVAEGSPQSLIEPLKGKVWSTIVPRGGTAPAHALYVTACPQGIKVVTVAESSPGAEYSPIAPRLDDVYHAALA